jgi:hypothetical protein
MIFNFEYATNKFSFLKKLKKFSKKKIIYFLSFFLIILFIISFYKNIQSLKYKKDNFNYQNTLKKTQLNVNDLKEKISIFNQNKNLIENNLKNEKINEKNFISENENLNEKKQSKESELKKLNETYINKKEEYSKLLNFYIEKLGKQNVKIPLEPFPNYPSTDLYSTSHYIENSTIIKFKWQEIQLNEWIYSDGTLIYELIYSSSKSGFSSKNVKEALKSKSPYKNTLFIIQLEDYTIIGGFTFSPWEGEGFIRGSGTFLFNLDNQKKYRVVDDSKALFNSENIICEFGDEDLVVKDNEAYSKFPKSFGDPTNNMNIMKNELTNGNETLKIKQFEIYMLKRDYYSDNQYEE